MSRKDYELIASIFKERIGREIEAGNIAVLVLFAFDFAVEFEKDNPRFDHERFITACGVS